MHTIVLIDELFGFNTFWFETLNEYLFILLFWNNNLHTVHILHSLTDNFSDWMDLLWNFEQTKHEFSL